MNKHTSIATNNNIFCSHCAGKNHLKKGFVRGIQRYLCKSCKRIFTMKPKRYDDLMKLFAVYLYLNNCGIRKIAKFLKVNPSTILR
jgi:transposase-like protein